MKIVLIGSEDLAGPLSAVRGIEVVVAAPDAPIAETVRAGVSNSTPDKLLFVIGVPDPQETHLTIASRLARAGYRTAMSSPTGFVPENVHLLSSPITASEVLSLIDGSAPEEPTPTPVAETPQAPPPAAAEWSTPTAPQPSAWDQQPQPPAPDPAHADPAAAHADQHPASSMADGPGQGPTFVPQPEAPPAPPPQPDAWAAAPSPEPDSAQWAPPPSEPAPLNPNGGWDQPAAEPAPSPYPQPDTAVQAPDWANTPAQPQAPAVAPPDPEVAPVQQPEAPSWAAQAPADRPVSPPAPTQTSAPVDTPQPLVEAPGWATQAPQVQPPVPEPQQSPQAPGWATEAPQSPAVPNPFPEPPPAPQQHIPAPEWPTAPPQGPPTAPTAAQIPDVAFQAPRQQPPVAPVQPVAPHQPMAQPPTQPPAQPGWAHQPAPEAGNPTYAPQLARPEDAVQSAQSFRESMFAKTAREGQVVVISAAKGGVGKSSFGLLFSAVMAESLAETGKAVVHVDSNLVQADAARYLGRSDVATVTSLAREAIIDEAAIARVLTRLDNRPLALLAGPNRPEEAAPDILTPALMGKIVTVLRTMFDYVVVDAPAADIHSPVFTKFLMPEADHLLVVVDTNKVALEATQRWLHSVTNPRHAGGSDYPVEKVNIVFNRYRPNIGMDEDDIREALARFKYVGKIPDSDQWMRAANSGDLFSLPPRAYESLRDVALQVTGDPMIRPSKRSGSGGEGGLLKRLMAGRGR